MSPKAFARSGIALALLTAAACSDTLAPRLERIQSQIANAFGCDVRWTGATDNQWQNPGNWTTLAVPNGTQEVCITTDAPTMVVVRGDAFAKNITIGAPGNSTRQTLAIEGYFGSGAKANLSVSGGIDNYGDLVLRGSGHFPAWPSLVAGTIENHSSGVMLASDVGFSGGITYVVKANVVNDGLMDFRYFMELTGHWTNRGATRMAAGSSYILTNGTWIQAGGSLDAQGTFVLRDGLLRLEGGAMTGAIGPIRQRGTLEIANGSTSTGNVSLRETVAMSGDVPAGLNVIIDGFRAGTTGLIFNTIVTAANAFRNEGTLRLTGSGDGFGSSSMLVVPGLLDNYGRIEVMPGPGDGTGRWLRASVHNRPGAVMHIATALEMDRTGATYVNEGTITVGPSRALSITNGASFAQLGGAFTIGAGAPVLLNGGAFQFDGGAVTGQMPRLHETALSIAPTSTATGTLLLTGTTSLTGDVKAGQTLFVETIRPSSTGNSINATLNVTGNTINHGTIRLWAQGAGAGPAFITVANGATLTNAAGARMEVLTDFDQGNFSSGRELRGNFVNEGTLHLATALEYRSGTMRTLAPATVTATITAANGGLLSVNPGATLHASGSFAAHIVNGGNLHIGATGTAAALNVGRWYDGRNTSSVTVEIGGSPSAPGADFDRATFNGPMSIGNATLHVRAVNGQCIDGGKSFDVFLAQGFGQMFVAFTGLDLGGGRTVVPEQLSDRYRLRVQGPPCPPPDASPPVITPNVSGTMGLAGWYTSDVSVSWTVTDAESPVTSSTGCDNTTVTTDTPGITLTCSATSAGGTRTQSVNFKRDATPPVIEKTFSAEPNAHGWYNAALSVALRVWDDMSGPTGGSLIGVFSFNQEGANQSQTLSMRDNAGNVAVATVAGINVDLTPPVATVTRLPEANANGWNNTEVSATFSATDALSGMDGTSSSTQLFGVEGANQGASRVFTDKAGNSTTIGIGGISIDRTAPVVSATRAPAANANGWNNSDVTATYSATDALSGIDGSSSATQLFASEGTSQGGSRVFTDKAGNSATASIGGISIDKTAPTVTVTRSPAPDATGWNNTDVTATWTATDALSGIAGSSTATMLFEQDGANQSGSRTFSDLAGNSASATIANINIDKTPEPPPPPPPPTTITPVCSVTPNEIWPANNKPVRVSVSVGGSGVTSFKLRSVTNNESGTADAEGWAIGTADVEGTVLAKRNGNGSGRTYTLTYDVFGANGATGSCAVTVRVPHDQRR